MISSLPLLALLGTALAVRPPSLSFARRPCYEGEPVDLLCYNPPDGDPQFVDVDDVAFIAAALRAYGAETRFGRLLSMAAADTPDCGEWTLYERGTALAVAKHVNNTVDSSVLFADIANTIDGGVGATPAQKEAAIIGCLSSGGSLGVQVNPAAPAYSMPNYYPQGYVTDGILIKIVSSGV